MRRTESHTFFSLTKTLLFLVMLACLNNLSANESTPPQVRHDASSLLEEGPVVELRLEELGIKIMRQKLFDRSTNEATRKNWIQETRGPRFLTDAEVDQLIEQDKQIYLTREGAIHKTFLPIVKKAVKMDPDRLFQIAVWAPVPPGAIPLRPPGIPARADRGGA